ncbi:MAG: response regulator, partial [Acidobacteria bacterium]|nr:response regulator [Acidobacteriota bacterium]
EGQVVGADTRSASVEDLLGAVLVRTGRITSEQLRQALALQKKTLQRLG